MKFMPVHIPTPEEKTHPILFAKVGVSWFVVFFSSSYFLKPKAVQREMALELGVPATDVQRAEFVKELRKEK